MQLLADVMPNGVKADVICLADVNALYVLADVIAKR